MMSPFIQQDVSPLTRVTRLLFGLGLERMLVGVMLVSVMGFIAVQTEVRPGKIWA